MKTNILLAIAILSVTVACGAPPEEAPDDLAQELPVSAVELNSSSVGATLLLYYPPDLARQKAPVRVYPLNGQPHDGQVRWIRDPGRTVLYISERLTGAFKVEPLPAHRLVQTYLVANGGANYSIRFLEGGTEVPNPPMPVIP